MLFWVEVRLICNAGMSEIVISVIWMVLACFRVGGGSGQGQVVKQEVSRGHSTMSYLARSTSTCYKYQFGGTPSAMTLLNSLSTWMSFKALSGATMGLPVSA